MAGVRAEIIAASRSRRGWLDGAPPNPERRPYISTIKSNFEDQSEKSDKKMGTNEKSESSRKMGTKVSTIANMFQSLSPQKADNSVQTKSSHSNKETAKKYLHKENDSDSITQEQKRIEKLASKESSLLAPSSFTRTGSHLARFNNAKAMFERLEERIKKTDNAPCIASKKQQGNSSRVSPICTTSTSCSSSGSMSSSQSPSSPCSSAEDGAYDHQATLLHSATSKTAISIECKDSNKQKCERDNLHNVPKMKSNKDLRVQVGIVDPMQRRPVSPPKYILDLDQESQKDSCQRRTTEEYNEKNIITASAVNCKKEEECDSCVRQWDSLKYPSQPTIGIKDNQVESPPLYPAAIHVERQSSKESLQSYDSTSSELQSRQSSRDSLNLFSRDNIATSQITDTNKPSETASKPPKSLGLLQSGSTFQGYRHYSEKDQIELKSEAHSSADVIKNIDSSISQGNLDENTFEEYKNSPPQSPETMVQTICASHEEDKPLSPKSEIQRTSSPSFIKELCTYSQTNEMSNVQSLDTLQLSHINNKEDSVSTRTGSEEFAPSHILTIRTSPLPQIRKENSLLAPQIVVEKPTSSLHEEPYIPLLSPATTENELCDDSCLPKQETSQKVLHNGYYSDSSYINVNQQVSPHESVSDMKFRDSSVHLTKSVQSAKVPHVAQIDQFVSSIHSPSNLPAVPQTVLSRTSEMQNKPLFTDVTCHSPNAFGAISSPEETAKHHESPVTPEVEMLSPKWLDSSQDDSNYWKSDSSDQDESNVGSPYEQTSSLRHAAGETLAECQDGELFLAEAEQDAEEHEICQSESFRSPGSRESEVDDVELMTQEEAEKLLSSGPRQQLLSDEEAQEVVYLLSKQRTMSNSDLSSSSMSAPSSMYEEDEDGSGEAFCDSPFPPGTSVMYENVEYHILSNGHYYTEIPGLDDDSGDDELPYFCPTLPRKKSKVKFSTSQIKVYSTHSVEEYDRRNEDVDPVSASAEYELEKRIEKMDVFPVELMKGPEGLGLSIIGMGVGADAGLEKLGIFVKTVTKAGAAMRDGRIQVNDQIIEVDGKSLVGVTQAYAASVLRNTSGLVRFLIGREMEGTNSEIAQLISQSLEADKEREAQQQQDEDKDEEDEIEQYCAEHADSSNALCLKDLRHCLGSHSSTSISSGSTPEEGEDGPIIEVFDLANDSSDSLSPDTDVETLKVKFKEAQYKNAVAEAELKKVKDKLLALERIDSEKIEYLRQLNAAQRQLQEAEQALQITQQEVVRCRQVMEEAQGQYITLEKKYLKAKKLIKEFQQREQDFIHQEEYHLQQLQEKDHEYNALVKSLKDRVIILEHNLTETQKVAGLPVQLPYNSTLKQITPQKTNYTIRATATRVHCLDLDVSDTELPDGDLTKYDISPDDDGDENIKRSTVERKPVRDETFDKAVPQTELLDTSVAKAKAELASKGSLANRQPPSLRKQSSSSSTDGTPPLDRRNSSDSWDDVIDDSIDNSQLPKSPSDCPSPSYIPHPDSYQSSPSSPPPYTSTSPDSLYPPTFSPPLGSSTKPLSFLEEIKAAVIERQYRGQSISSPSHDEKTLSPVFSEGSATSPNEDRQRGNSPGNISQSERRPHQWQGGPVHEWTATQVGQWLLLQGFDQYIPQFLESDISGQILLQMDNTRLKALGVLNSADRSSLKKKVKDMRAQMEKERKAQEKEQRAREKQQKKAERASKKK